MQRFASIPAVLAAAAMAALTGGPLLAPENDPVKFALGTSRPRLAAKSRASKDRLRGRVRLLPPLLYRVRRPVKPILCDTLPAHHPLVRWAAR